MYCSTEDTSLRDFYIMTLSLCYWAGARSSVGYVMVVVKVTLWLRIIILTSLRRKVAVTISDIVVINTSTRWKYYKLALLLYDQSWFPKWVKQGEVESARAILQKLLLYLLVLLINVFLMPIQNLLKACPPKTPVCCIFESVCMIRLLVTCK